MKTKSPALLKEIRKVSDELVALRNSRSRLTWRIPEHHMQIKKLSIAIKEKTKAHSQLRKELS